MTWTRHRRIIASCPKARARYGPEAYRRFFFEIVGGVERPA